MKYIKRTFLWMALLLSLAGTAWPQKKQTGRVRGSGDSSGSRPSRKLIVEDRYLHFPVRKGAPTQRISLYVNDTKVREMDISLAAGEPDFWVYTDIGEWIGKTLVIEKDRPAPEPFANEGSLAPNESSPAAASQPAAARADGLADFFQSNAKDGADLAYQEKERPQFHFTSRRGWLNDPNGLVFYKGEWHLFYQHNPFSRDWGNMTWGHAISKDLVHWKEMDDALHPDKLGTMFSGSAVVDRLNTTGFQKGEESPLVAMYTAAGDNSGWSAHQPFSQCIAYSIDKGRHWTKYEKNPVLPHIVGGNRDPKLVWHEPTHQWIVALYLDSITYALFASPDLKSWKELQRLEIGPGVSECPDFFEIPIDGKAGLKKWVLTGASNHYLVGSFDGKAFHPEQAPRQGDFGSNYYAVQSYSDVPSEDGRRIQIGWMNGADIPNPAFNQQMAFPRELTLHATDSGLRLFSRPAREIALLHEGSHRWTDIVIKDDNKEQDNPARSLQGECFHIKAEFQPDSNGAKEVGFVVRGFGIWYEPKTKMLHVSDPKDPGKVNQTYLPDMDGRLRLEILLDRASIEIFANEGVVPMAFGYIPDGSDRGIRIIAHEGNIVLKSLEVFDLTSAWKSN